MRCLARISLGVLGLALIAPTGARAQVAPTTMPSGYQVAPANAYAPGSAPAAPAARPVEAAHKHRGKVLCARCAAKLQAPGTMPPGQIVACEHSKNGACPACLAALSMPGTFVTAGGQPAQAAVEAPGRALASSGAAPAQGFDPNLVEPAPVGVVQANFSQGGPAGMPAGLAPQANPNAPGRAMVESNAGRDPYQARSGPFPHPHILGHLFGWSGIGNEKADERAQRKAETHAMITYDENGNAPVTELPASAVFGKKGR